MQREQMITVTVYIYTRYTREKLKKKRYKNKWTKKRRKYYISRRETYRGYVNDVFAYLFTQQSKQIKSPKVLTTKSRPPRLPLSTPADGVPMAYRWRTTRASHKDVETTSSSTPNGVAKRISSSEA